MLNIFKRSSGLGRCVFNRRYVHSSTIFMQIEEKQPASQTTTSIPFRNDFSQQAADSRRKWSENFTKTSLDNLAGWWEPNAPFDEEHLAANTENAIGVIRIPVGVVGPISIRGKYADGQFLVPAATLEGALLASASRGARVLDKAGGVVAHAYRQRIIRVPVFYCDTPEDAEMLGELIQRSLPKLHEVVASVSKRARLKSVDFFTDEQKLNVFFVYESGEAAGQNMSNSCTSVCCDWIVNNFSNIKINHYCLENLLSGDKQVSAFNALFGRGVSVVARASLPDALIESALHTTSDKFIDAFSLARDYQHKVMSPSVQIGNVPNMVAAMFAAFGQDLGSVGECSQAFLNIRKGHESGYMDVELKMPSLAIGTVGGGTALPTQSQCLAMVGCDGGPHSNRKLAEIIASVCLAADLSLMASLVTNTHATSHDKIGRNRPVTT